MKKTYGLLDAEEQIRLDQLVEGMTQEQLLWISGYLAGLTKSKAKKKDVHSPEIQILYGTHSGNSEWLAELLLEKGIANGLNIGMSIMEKYDTRAMVNLKYLIIIVSTHGEGDPPANAISLLSFLHDKNTPELAHLKYAVLGLGDKTFANFAKAGVDFDQALEKKKAQRISSLLTCDVDFNAQAKAWIDDVLYKLKGEDSDLLETKVENTATNPISTSFISTFKPIYDRSNPFYAKVLRKVRLSGKSSEKDVYHLELSLMGSGFTYSPGDILSIIGNNPPELVTAILQRLSINPNQEIVLDNRVMKVYRALKNYLEITVLSTDVLKKYNAYIQSVVLSDLLNQPEMLKIYIYGADLLDLLTDYSGKITAQELVSVLRKLPPRKYSIASSSSVCGAEAHITVAGVKYNSRNRLRQGAVSSFATERIKVGDKMPILIHKNNNFKMPDDPNALIIMIGPGTGVAPFRAFMQERSSKNILGKSWLFFGDQHQASDFLYGDDWNIHLESGLLDGLDLAFSRDQEEKIYVQHRILEQGAKVWNWLNKGAYIYVCGDKKRMATDVHLALLDVVSEHGKMSINDAKKYLNNLVKGKKYQKDVY